MWCVYCQVHVYMEIMNNGSGEFLNLSHYGNITGWTWGSLRLLSIGVIGITVIPRQHTVKWLKANHCYYFPVVKNLEFQFFADSFSSSFRNLKSNLLNLPWPSSRYSFLTLGLIWLPYSTDPLKHRWLVSGSDPIPLPAVAGYPFLKIARGRLYTAGNRK